jgi:hypothetical protein
VNREVSSRDGLLPLRPIAAAAMATWGSQAKSIVRVGAWSG